MSILVTGKFYGDVAAFQQALSDRGEEFAAIGKRAQTVGAVHHRFGVGDGYVVIIDEWDSVEQFHSFFGDPELQAFIGSVGADTSREPEMTISTAVASPDEF